MTSEEAKGWSPHPREKLPVKAELCSPSHRHTQAKKDVCAAHGQRALPAYEWGLDGSGGWGGNE